VFNNRLWAVGAFLARPSGEAAAQIVSFDPTTSSFSIPSATRPAVYGVNGDVIAITTYKGKVYIGGYFTSTGDGMTPLNRIASVDPVTARLSPLPCGSSNGVNNQVTEFAEFQGKLYMSGGFSALGNGTSITRLATYDGATWASVGNESIAASALAVFQDQLWVPSMCRCSC
jgi:hypothetical protein